MKNRRHLLYFLGRLAFLTLALSSPSYGASEDKSTMRPRYNSHYSTESTGLDSFHRDVQATRPVGHPKDVETVRLSWQSRQRPIVIGVPSYNSRAKGRIVGRTLTGDTITYSLLPDLQEFTEKLVQRTKAPHVAVVAMDPKSGRVLALADKSVHLRDAAFHSGFPAASLFKVVTAAAAVERAKVAPDAPIKFRGGNYTLNQWNYLPNARTDRRSMPLDEALGRSCNPVFGRVALRYLTPEALRSFAERFGFNERLYFDAPLPDSTARIPTDKYGLSRTAAGFGEVTISPIHAAALMAGLANSGRMPRPVLIESIANRDGNTIYSGQPEIIAQMVRPDTAQKVMQMMEQTTTIGTSSRDFAPRRGARALPVDVAAKTGTLSGKNPKGLNHWFIAAAPLQNPKIAVAIIVVDPMNSAARAARLGKEVMEYFLFRR